MFKRTKLKNLFEEVKLMTQDHIIAQTMDKKNYLVEVPAGYEQSCLSLIEKHKLKVLKKYYFYQKVGFVIK